MMTITSKTFKHQNLRSRKRVLVVDDERDLAELLVYNLSAAGYETCAAHDGAAALESIAQNRPDLVVLDLMLPELSGTEVATRIRTNPSTSSIPIIMLTAKTDEVDQIVGLAVGADDYVTKPFSVKVLLARIEAILRRATETTASGPLLRLGDISVNTGTHQAFVDGRAVRLTLTEFRLLVSLMQAGGRVLTRHSLMAKAMGPGVTVTERTIDVHMTAIRRKLGDQGALIHTVRGVGYRASAEPELTGA